MKRLIIIEDNSRIREGFVAAIDNSDNYEVVAQYSNCEEALANFDTDLPEVVLMDIELPGMNGIIGTTLIKKKRASCIVLIITVFEDSEKVFQSLCAGASGYLVKNSNPAEIIRNLDEAFAGGAPMSLSIARMVVQSFRIASDSPLSDRETEVLRAVAEGKTYTKIANDLFVSKETVRSHIKNIYHKLAVNSKSEALKVAGNNKWLNRF